MPKKAKYSPKDALAKLKEAHKNQDLNAIDTALANLNAVWQAASEEMYKTAQNAGPGASQSGPGQPGPQEPGSGGGNSKSAGDEVTDVDFEEVK